MRAKQIILVFFGFLGLIHVCMSYAADITLVPSIKMSGEYNDNILFSRTDVLDDVVSQADPGISLYYNTGRIVLSSKAKASVLRYMENPELDNEYYSMDLGGRFSPVERFQINAGLSQLMDTTLDTELQETGLLTIREDSSRLNANGGFWYGINEISNISMSYSFTDVDYDSGSHVDYKGHSVSMTYARQLFDAKNSISLQPYFTQNTSVVSRSDNMGLAVGWSHILNETWSSHISLGTRKSKTQYYFIKEKSRGWVVDLSFNKKGENWSMELGYDRDMVYSSAGSPLEKDNLNIRFQRNISDRARANISGGVTFSRSDNLYNRQDSRNFRLSPSFRYLFTEDLYLDLNYTYSYNYNKLLETMPGVDRNTFRLTINYEYEEKL